MCIQKKIQHVRKEKGASYFENLCHLLPNSDVRNSFVLLTKNIV